MSLKKTIKDFGTFSWGESSEFLPLYLSTWLTAPHGSIMINVSYITVLSTFFISLWMLKIMSDARFKVVCPRWSWKEWKLLHEIYRKRRFRTSSQRWNSFDYWIEKPLYWTSYFAMKEWLTSKIMSLRKFWSNFQSICYESCSHIFSFFLQLCLSSIELFAALTWIFQQSLLTSLKFDNIFSGY